MTRPPEDPRRCSFGWLSMLATLWLVGASGCSSLSSPCFTATGPSVRAEWSRMKREPAPPERPLLVLDGWRQPEFSARAFAHTLRSLTGAPPGRVLAVSFFLRGNLDAMADDTIARVEQQWPSDDPDWTTEVDAVGFSMGGIVARAAAMERPGSPGKRLRVRRLYTIATPHRGARLARTIALDQAARDMRPGSAFLARLDAALPDAGYKLVCYGHTNDKVVGARNTAPPGREPIWTYGTMFFSHLATRLDRRILVDLALRLRGEPPLAGAPSAPPRD